MKRRSAIILVLCFLSLCSFAQLNKSYFFYKGREYIIAGRYREAIECLNILLRSEPHEYEGYFLRGVAKFNLDDLNGAQLDFTLAISEKPAYTQALQYRAITRSRLGQYNESLADFGAALSFRPDDAGIYYSRGVTFFLNQDFTNSVSDFTEFIRLQPREPEGYLNRGTSRLYLKDTVGAEEDYNHAIKVNPYWGDSYMRRGLLRLMKNQYKPSIEDLSKSILIDSTFAIAYFYRAIARNNVSDLKGALSDFNSSIKYDSTNSVAYFNRAILRSQIGDYNNAIVDYTKVALSNPENVLVYYNRGSTYATLGNLNAALHDYDMAISLYPDFANAYLLRSSVKAQMGDIHGSKSDRQIAEAKIKEYKSKMNDSMFSAYADTSKQFNRILSFDANFASKNKDFSNIRSDIRNEVKQLPLFRLTIASPDTTYGVVNPSKYENRKLERFIASSKIEGLRLLNWTTDLQVEYIEYLDDKNNQPSTKEELFKKSITQSLQSQYASALNYLNYIISQGVSEPYAYMNRATVQAEMIDFVASLEGSYQSMKNLDPDPAVRLHQSSRKVKYDYSGVIADLNKAIELMPELPHLYYNMGGILMKQGDYPGAILQYNKAIELFPYFAEAYYNRGIAQIIVGELTTGCMDISRAGELGIEEAYSVIKKYCK